MWDITDRTCSAICLTTMGAHLGFAVKRLDEGSAVAEGRSR